MKSELVSKLGINFYKDFKPSPELEELQYLMPISEDDYKHLKEDIEKTGEVRDAIKCYQDKDGNFFILGGLNRWKIAKELNIQEIPIQIYKGSIQEYRELVINDNLNRRHLSLEDKKRIAAEFFKIKPDRSANDVAKKTGLDDKTAGKVKKDLQARSEIPNVTTIDTKGRPQPEKKKTPVKNKVNLSEITARIIQNIKTELDKLNKEDAQTVCIEVENYLSKRK